MLLLFLSVSHRQCFSLKIQFMAKKDYQDFKLDINMKTILLYEEMSGKSFYDVSGEDMLLLIYCALVINNNIPMTLSLFKNIMKNEKILSNPEARR